ncbi:HD-GYP domain-containing protein [Senegalia sp. (in: firmicutes)]|uniref:HD-GYP domain-containing protein n=1 Tax=Senegalia sp. (in: firmicutes) TaxID=1924098 RepID=UPI003F9A21BB
MEKNMRPNNDLENHKFFEIYDELQNKIEILFTDINGGKKVKISNLDDEVDEIIKYILNNNNILSLLKQSDNSKYLIYHSINVGLISLTIGIALGYSNKRLKDLLISGLFHDIGMIKVPQKIIDKAGPLSQEEFIIIINHTITGYKILKEISNINPEITYGALHHHEREDGSGYPLGIKSDEIHEFGKIISIADIFDAMTTDKIYKKKKSPFMAAEEILYNSVGILDNEITTDFLNNISKHYIGSRVKLNDGSIGEIIEINNAIPTRPIVNINGKVIDLIGDNNYEIIDIIN